jgi:NAD(P)-dependent dehydrogenase (short-subunit alcohol dehydrogenase family)
MTTPFAGKVALVTGAAGGIGLASAERLAADGAAVVLADIQSEPLRRAAAGLTAAGRNALAHRTDVAVAEEIAGLVNAAIKAFGRLDIVVNAAGIQPYGTVVDTDPNTWDRVFAVNLKAIYMIARQAIPHMREVGGGAIVNIASVQSLASSARVAAYAASKAGVLGLTRSLAIDHAREGIRSNAICPGSIDTPLLRFAARENKGGRSEEDMFASWGAMHPVGRVGQAAEIAALVAFLAGPESAFINGTAITADGGVMAKLGIVLPG